MKNKITFFITLLLVTNILLISSCKDKIKIDMLLDKTWVKYKITTIDSTNVEKDISYLFFNTECSKNNTNIFKSNQDYIKYMECPTMTDPFDNDTLIWQYDKKFNQLNTYVDFGGETGKLLLDELYIEKLNETEFVTSEKIENLKLRKYYKLK